MNVAQLLEEIPKRYPSATVKSEFEYPPYDYFRVTLENGWTIGCGYGEGHYSSNRIQGHFNPKEATSFEVAILTETGEWFLSEGMDISVGPKVSSGVLGWVDSDHLFQIIEYISAKRREPP